MRLSIITVCLNSAPTLERAIDSVVSQNDPDVEYIIMDGGSSDGTVDIIKQRQALGHVTHYRSEKDNGIADAFNKGLSLCTGDVIGILNSDDYYPPDTFTTIRTHCPTSGKGFIVHGDMLVEKQGRFNRVKPRRLPQWWKYVDSPFSHPGMFISRNVYDSIGVYNTRYRYVMDYDFFLRALAAQIPFIYVNRVLSIFSSAGASGRSPRACHRELLQCQRENGLFAPACLTTFVAKMTVSYAKSLLGLYA